MVNDLGIADVEEPEMARLSDEVRALSDEELDRTLASRLDLPYPVDAEVLERAFSRVEEPERLSGGFTGADRKSTRLNSSHANISYAVFCLKKKKKKNKK